MLNKEEFSAFLMLLLAFVKANGFSAATAARVLGGSHQTMARWLSQARRLSAGQEPTITAYSFMVEPIVDKLNKLNELDNQRQLYTAISREPLQTKLEILHGALDGRSF